MGFVLSYCSCSSISASLGPAEHVTDALGIPGVDDFGDPAIRMSGSSCVTRFRLRAQEDLR